MGYSHGGASRNQVALLCGDRLLLTFRLRHLIHGWEAKGLSSHVNTPRPHNAAAYILLWNKVSWSFTIFSKSENLKKKFQCLWRYHKIGIMVLFVHDATDILLEFTKCNVYLKNRGGKYYAYHDHIANIGFVAFTIAW